MKRNLYLFLLTAALLIPGLSKAQPDLGFAYTYQGTTLYYKADSFGNLEVVPPFDSLGNYNAPIGDVVIPPQINGRPVIKIGFGAFSACVEMTSVSIPSTVSEIQSLAFYDCTSLTSINIPNGVREINAATFTNCTSLVSISIPNTIERIGDSAFAHCTSLTSINIPNGVREINTATFTNCTSLASISIPNTIERIGNSAFAHCTSITTISIPESLLVIIDELAFSGCTGLVTVSLPDSMWYIAYGAFLGCSSLTSINIPNNLTELAPGLFNGCSSLSSITLPDSLRRIGAYTFYGCSGLSSITLPNTLTRIEGWAFHGCSSLSSITIPCSIYEISGAAFDSCVGLTTLSFPNIIPELFPRMIIGASAFSNCTSLDSIFIGSSVANINRSAFLNCGYISSIVVDTNNHIYDSRNGCNAIIKTNENSLYIGFASTIIPPTVTSIGDRAFQLCSSLESITIPSNITSMSDISFWGCDNLTDVYMLGDIPPNLPYSNCPFSASVNVHIPCHSYNVYHNNYAWSQCNLIDTCVIYRAVTVRNNGGGMVRLLTDSEITVSDSTSATLMDSTQIRLWLYTILPNTEAASQVGSSRLSRLMVNGSEFPLNDNNTCRINDYSNSEGYIEYRINMIVDTDMTIEAYFVPYLPASVTVTASDSTLGLVSGGGSYYQYDEVVLSAFAKTGSTFLGWSNGSEDNPLTVELMSDTVLVAYFADNNISDSVIVLIHDTTYINLPYAVHDTTYIDVYLHDTTVVIDTVIQTEYIPVHDTTYVNIYDTTYIDNYIHDTTYIDNYIHDTTYIDNYIHDTTYVDNYIYDTTYVDNYIFDTTYIDNYIYDTSFVTDTLWLVDTLYLHDTVYIHDTIYITQEGVENAETMPIKVYQRNGHVVVEDFGNEDVHLYDLLGRRLAIRRKDDSKLSADDNANSVSFDVPSSGAYIIKVGNIATRKIVVVK